MVRATSGNFEVMRGWKSDNCCDVVLLLRKFNKVLIFAFLDIVVINDDDGRATPNFSAEFCIVLLLYLD